MTAVELGLINRCRRSNALHTDICQTLHDIDFSYYKSNQNKLRALAVVTPSGPVNPSVTNVQTGRYQPLSRPLVLYIND
jgi:hypothetical protein